MGQRNKLVKVSQSSTLAQNRLTVVEDECDSRGLDASSSELGLKRSTRLASPLPEGSILLYSLRLIHHSIFATCSQDGLRVLMRSLLLRRRRLHRKFTRRFANQKKKNNRLVFCHHPRAIMRSISFGLEKPLRLYLICVLSSIRPPQYLPSRAFDVFHRTLQFFFPATTPSPLSPPKFTFPDLPEKIN